MLLELHDCAPPSCGTCGHGQHPWMSIVLGRTRNGSRFSSSKSCVHVFCVCPHLAALNVLAVRFDLIRFVLISFLRRESHWSAQDPFYFLRLFLFFKCLERRFCQQSPRPCRNVRFPRFAPGGAAVIADLVPKSTIVAGSTRQNGG